MRIATWNVNSVRARLPRVTAWLDAVRPDVLCLQETKATDADFPRAEFETLGYRVESFGQPSYHGVAIVSREPLTGVFRGLPDAAPDEDRRLIGGDLRGVRIVGVYVPNGTEVGSERFAAKLRWFGRLRAMLEAATKPGEPLVVCGDFNVAPEERDCHDPDAWRGRILFHPDERRALVQLMDWGLVDLFRLHEEGAGHYTWWDYRGGAFRLGQGLRIDLMLASAALARRCRSVVIDREARKGERPSDHAPVLAEFAEDPGGG
ncbi:MAG: exodeoxyribonuclease III [Candidatus Eisenbacteria bacterium]|uniref:Exodeoxyribonuclease III n=1 Tax=Eiseniibacteriota bacterium TaxID=2212470 RepID=A0A937XA43_UNCEI|nr:exodeoxyribonuclease III [Candidatus Eisenbacteria bacterium]